MRTASIVLLFMAVLAAGVHTVSHLQLYWMADRLARLCRKLGGDPPRYSLLLGGPGPRFWDYILRECRRPGREKLRAMAEKTQEVLVVQMVGGWAFLAFAAFGLLLRCLAR